MKILYITGMLYLIMINMAGFAAMGIDKYRAKKNEWRVKEKTLFFLAAVGGSVGSILGMQCFHHKTKHYRFVYGMPVLLILQILLIICLLRVLK